MPSSAVAVDGMICISPVALAGVPSAMTVGRPALSRNIIASRSSARTLVPATARSIARRQRRVRATLCSTPPGLSA